MSMGIAVALHAWRHVNLGMSYSALLLLLCMHILCIACPTSWQGTLHCFTTCCWDTRA
jgi:hypothetical protein